MVLFLWRKLSYWSVKRVLETVEKHFNDCDPNYFSPSSELNEDFKGIDEVKRIVKDFKIKDINKIKPGVGETTRVLLRRVPDRVLIPQDANPKYLQHILQLAEENKFLLNIIHLKSTMFVASLKS